jgi:hypothetical protein
MEGESRLTLRNVAFQIMNASVALSEYDAKTRRTQRKRKEVLTFWNLIFGF